MDIKRTEGPLDSIGKIAKGATIVFVGNMLGYLFAFLTKIIIARHYGKLEFGLFNIAFATMMTTTAITSLGLNVGIARFIAMLSGQGKKQEIISFVRAGLLVISTMSLISAFVLYLFAPDIAKLLHGEADLYRLIRFFAVIGPFFVLLDFNMGILRGYQNMIALTLFFNIMRLLIRIVCILIFIMVGLEIQTIPVAYVLGIVFSLVASYIYIGKKYSVFQFFIFRNGLNNKKKIDAKNSLYSSFHELMSFSLPLFFSTFTLVIRQWFSLLLIGLFLSPALVGIYSAAIPVSQLMTIFLFSINKILLPVASSLLGKGEKNEIIIVYHMVTHWTLTLTLPVFFMIIIFPQQILFFIFGSEYIQAAQVLRILAIGNFINASTGPFGEILQTYGKTNYLFRLTMTGAFLYIALIVMLAPFYGIQGAAVAMAISVIYMCFMGVFYLHKSAACLPYTKKYFKILFFGFATLINLVWLHKFPILLNSPLVLLSITIAMSILYVVILYLTGNISKVELLAIKDSKTFNFLRKKEHQNKIVK